jgi:hypothetical protein
MRKFIAIAGTFLIAILGAKALEVTIFKVDIKAGTVNINGVTQNNNNSGTQVSNGSKSESSKIEPKVESKVEPLDIPVSIVFVPNK